MANVFRISYLPSVKSGKDLGQQLVIHTDEGTFYQSYHTIVCKVYRGKAFNWNILLSKDWNISRTTKVYTAKFLEMFGFQIHSSMDVENAIKSGQITLVERLTFDMYIRLIT